jgi:hypothetical protein
MGDVADPDGSVCLCLRSAEEGQGVTAGRNLSRWFCFSVSSVAALSNRLDSHPIGCLRPIGRPDVSVLLWWSTCEPDRR